MKQLHMNDVRHFYRSIKLGGPVKMAKLFEDSNVAMSEFFEEKTFGSAYSVKKIAKTLKIQNKQNYYYIIKSFMQQVKKMQNEEYHESSKSSSD